MEIGDYLRVFRRRLWLLILLPVAAAAAVVAFLALQPTMYRATATVAAPALVGGAQTNQYSGAAGTKTFVSNYEAAIISPTIVNKVAQETKVSTTAITDGLTVAPINADSSLLKVQYAARNAKTAEAVVRQAAGDTLTFLFSTQSDLAKKQVNTAQREATTAQTALSGFEKQNGVQLDQAYQTDLQLISTLRSQKAAQQAAGNSSGAAVLDAQIKSEQAALAVLAPKVTQYQALTAALTQAQSRLDVAQQSEGSAAAQLNAADPSRTVTVTAAKKVSKIVNMVKGGIVAGGAALFLAVCLVLLLELLGRSSVAREENAGTGRTGAVSSSRV